MALYFDSKKQVFRINIVKNGRRIRRSLPRQTTEETAREIHARLLNDVHRMDARVGTLPGWADELNTAYATPLSWLNKMHSETKGRCARRGIEFRLSIDDLRFLCLRSGGRCEVTGLPFNGQAIGPRNRRPFMQSLDRIQSMGAYSLENCRLVCQAVNFAMGSWGEDVVRQIAIGMVLNRFYPPWLEARSVDKCTPNLNVSESYR